ncbi:unnamed protein product [Auanema sp. JU1783]|nr:unnamed protein product [Auanema sp. JU1783]
MWCCCKRRSQVVREIKLVCVGIDSVGKTAVIKTIKGDDFRDVLPTNGFSVIEFPYSQTFNIKAFDLGGGERIRDIWTNYYAEVHGVIFVVDLTDPSRQDETYQCIRDCIENKDTFGKPFLFVMNNVAGGDIEDVDFCLTANLHESCEKNKQYPFVTHLRKMTSWKAIAANKAISQRVKINPTPLLQQFCDFIDKIVEQYVSISEGVRQAEVRLRIRQQEARDARKLRLMQIEHEQRKSEISLMEGYNAYTIPIRSDPQPPTISEEVPMEDLSASIKSSDIPIVQQNLLPSTSDTVPSPSADDLSALSSDVFEAEDTKEVKTVQTKKLPHNKIAPLNDDATTSTISSETTSDSAKKNGSITGKRLSSRMDRIKLALAKQKAAQMELSL